MKKIIIPFLAIALALLLAAATTTPALATPLSGTPADYPATGDTWKYNVTMLSPFGNMTGNSTIEVMDKVKIRAGFNESKEYECYNYTLTGEMTYTFENATTKIEVQIKLIGHMYYSTTDGSVVAEYSNMLTRQNITMKDFQILVVYEFESNGFTYSNDTWKMFDFPLEEGKTWSKDIESYYIGWQRMGSNSTGTWIEYKTSYDWSNTTRMPATVTGRVVNVTTVTTGAGTFECWLVNHTMGYGYSLMWYNPEVKNVVYRENYDENGVLSAKFNLTSYSVSYPMRTMIQNLLVLTLLQQMQSQQQTNLMIMAAVGVAVVVGVAAYFVRKR